MASSRNSPPAEPRDDSASAASPRRRRDGAEQPVDEAIRSALDAFVLPQQRVAVALSGGLDSMVLLDALVRESAARSIAVSAVHVDHGIAPDSRAWSDFCAEQCAQRGVPFVSHRLELREHRANLEALARRERYALLNSVDADAVALAHHADDQAETVLLQLLRGGGPRGLAAMPRFQPARSSSPAPALLRPLLALRRSILDDYARSHALAWIDDPSNDDRHHRRNLIRHEIAPRLAAAFPGYPETLRRAAENQSEASDLLDVLAQLDAESASPDGLDCARLAALDAPRARNVLRWYLRASGLRTPSRAQLDDMLRQLRSARADAHTTLTLDGAIIGVYRGHVRVHPPPPPVYTCEWNGEPELRVPGGKARFSPSVGEGFRREAGAEFTLRTRAGGERLQLAANRPRRALKKLLQDAGLAHWEREAVPLLWCGGSLVAVPGIGVDLAFQVRHDEPGWTLAWCPQQVRARAKPGD